MIGVGGPAKSAGGTRKIAVCDVRRDKIRNYLKDELLKRLDTEGVAVEYMLKIQLRRRPSLTGPEPEWVTSEYPWDETVHPFHDVAHVTLTEALDYEESMLTWFDMAKVYRDYLVRERGVSPLKDRIDGNPVLAYSVRAMRTKIFHGLKPRSLERNHGMYSDR